MVEERILTLDLAYNARHIGGYRTEDGGMTSNRYVRSGSLHHLAATGIEGLRRHGVRAVVDLRSPGELARDVTPDLTPAGIRTVHAPVFEALLIDALRRDGPIDYMVIYRRFLERGGHAYRVLFEVVAETDGGVLFHCSAGKDRTGLGAALLLAVAGVQANDICEDYGHSRALLLSLKEDPRMQAQMQAWRAQNGALPEQAAAALRSDPEMMAAVLNEIDARYGGVDGYLDQIGAGARLRTAVRERLTVRPAAGSTDA